MESKKEIHAPGNKFDDPLYAKQVKSLRSRVLHLIDSTRSSVIGITSAVDNEGKTSLALNLALSISNSGDTSVLLIDADMIKCSLTTIFGLEGAPGLSNHLNGSEGEEDARRSNTGVITLWECGLDNMAIIPSGNPVDNSADLLIKNAFKDLIDDVKGKFNIVIIDLPPVVSTPDPVSVKNRIDKFIFSYYTAKTPRALLEDAIREIGLEKILGVVLNRADKEKMLKYRKQYYYYYNAKK